MKFINGMIFGIGTGLITVALAGLQGKVSSESIYALVGIGLILVIAETARNLSFGSSGKEQKAV
ncbi:MAG: hypothetical protein JKY45_07950 [Emcibacter sp.]|nr:hypothetical protein [Emcibacter sp.]